MKKNKIKTTLIAIAVILLSALTITGCFAVIPKAEVIPSEYDEGITFEQASKEDKPILTVFYVDWCTYCKRLMPKLDKVRNIQRNNMNVVLINMDNPDNEKFAKKYRVSGYPTIYIIDPKYNYRAHIPGVFADSVMDLNSEVTKYLNLRKLLKKNESCK